MTFQLTNTKPKDAPIAPHPHPRRISIFGATGSIGDSTLDLLRLAPENYQLVALSAQQNVDKLARLAREFSTEIAVIGDALLYDDLKAALAGSNVKAAAGPEALIEAAQIPADWVMAAMVGTAGLAPTMAAIRQGRHVALANKEALVSAGQLMTMACQQSGASLLPVDSEHNAIFQCLSGARLDQLRRITLTASGGPFRQFSNAQMAEVTPEQAVAHPNWTMGAKISVDSASLMNKGLELIEAYHLFPIGLDKFEILIHPQSVIHSMVEFCDRSTLAQLGAPDMKIPIASTLAWPERMQTGCAPLDLATIGRLDFEPLDSERFPAPALCRAAIAQGGAAPAILNAANEVAVEAFLAGQIKFLDICIIVSETLSRYSPDKPETIETVLAIDKQARKLAQQLIINNDIG